MGAFIYDASSLASYLNQNKGYPNVALKPLYYRYQNEQYSRLEVLDKQGKYIVQSFVIMSESQKQSKSGYPFYRRYKQENPFGVEVAPTCAIAVLSDDNKEWRFYSANDMSEYFQDTFLDYDLAVKRFNLRFGRKMFRMIKTALYACLTLEIFYFILHILSVNHLVCFELPFNSAVVTLFVLFPVIALLPALFPYIKGIRLPGAGVDFKDSAKKR